MDFNKLYYFYVTAQHEHVTRAAEALHIAQPSLTRALHLLEEELGVPLLEKSGRNIRLTVFGNYLREKLDGALPALLGIPEELEMIREERSHSVRLNVLAASSVVTDAVISYQKNNRNVVFQFVQHEEKNGCDISVSTNDSGNRRDLPHLQRCVIEEQIYLAVPKRSAFAEEKTIDLRTVRGEHFVELASSRSFRCICDVFCACVGFRPHIVFESDSPEAVKNMIKANAGIAFWPEFSWGQLSGGTEIELLPISNPVCQRELVIELHPSAKTSDSALELYQYLDSYMKNRQKESQLKA